MSRKGFKKERENLSLLKRGYVFCFEPKKYCYISTLSTTTRMIYDVTLPSQLHMKYKCIVLGDSMSPIMYIINNL